MDTNNDAVDIALEIIYTLLQGNEISKEKNSELYSQYRNNVEIETMASKIAKKLGFEIYAMNQELTLCVMANNRVFGYTNEDLKNKLKQLNKNEDIYLMYFIIITLITCFYKESGYNTPRDYISLEELINTINIKFNKLVSEDMEKKSEELKCNFVDIKNVWDRLPDARKEVIGLAKNDKISFVKLILKFLQDEKLIRFDEQRRIITITNRFKSIVYFYFEYSKDNKNELMEYIYGLGGDENATY